MAGAFGKVVLATDANSGIGEPAPARRPRHRRSGPAAPPSRCIQLGADPILRRIWVAKRARSRVDNYLKARRTRRRTSRSELAKPADSSRGVCKLKVTRKLRSATAARSRFACVDCRARSPAAIARYAVATARSGRITRGRRYESMLRKARSPRTRGIGGLANIIGARPVVA
jgi:hypothetical protein